MESARDMSVRSHAVWSHKDMTVKNHAVYEVSYIDMHSQRSVFLVKKTSAYTRYISCDV